MSAVGDKIEEFKDRLPQKFCGELSAHFENQVRIPAGRLYLKPLLLSTYNEQESFCNAEERAFLKWRLKGYPMTGIPQQERVDYLLFMEHQQGTLTLGIHDQKTQKIIGALIAFEGNNGMARLSYFILPSERQKGYAKEAYEAGRKFLKDQMDIDLTYAQCKPKNTVSMNFLKVQGFVVNGRIRPNDPDYEGPGHVRLTSEVSL